MVFIGLRDVREYSVATGIFINTRHPTGTPNPSANPRLATLPLGSKRIFPEGMEGLG